MSATPILDLEANPPGRCPRKQPALVGAIVSLFGVVLLGFLSHLPPIEALLVIPPLYLEVAVHELGHVLAGR
jgi:hypothetical protein